MASDDGRVVETSKPFVWLHSHKNPDLANCECGSPYEWQIDAPLGFSWANSYRHFAHDGRHPSIWPTQAEAIDFAYTVFSDIDTWIEDGAIYRLETP